MPTQFIGVYATSYPAYGSAPTVPVLPRPAAPAPGTATATTVPLTTPVVAGAAGYRFQLATNAGFTTGLQTSPDQTAASGQTTPVGCTFSGLAASTGYYVRVMLVGDGTTQGDSGYSAAVQVSTAAPAGQLTSFNPADDRWSDGAYAMAKLGGKLRNTLANASGTTAASQIVVRVTGDVGTLGSQYQAVHIGCYLTSRTTNVTTYQALAFNSDGAVHDIALTNVPAGDKFIVLLVHDVARAAVGTQQVAGDVVLDVLADSVITWSPTATSDYTLQVVGDSISGGNSATDPLTQGFAALLRAQYAADATGVRVVVDSFSGGSLLELYGANVSAADKASYRARLLSQASGRKGNQLLLQYGTNDADRLNATPADFGAAYGALLDDLHADQPDLQLIALTPFPVASYENKLEPLRAAIRTVVAARSFVYKLIEGPDIVSISNRAPDGVHWLTAGHREIFANLYSLLTGGAFADYFQSTTYDYARWTNQFQQPNTTQAVTSQGGGLFTISAPSGSGAQSGYTSQAPYALTPGRAYSAQIGSVLPAPDSLLQLVVWSGQIGSGYTQTAGLAVVNGALIATTSGFNSAGSIAYDATAHRYWRLKPVSTTTADFQVSADGLSWNTPFPNVNTGLNLASVILLAGGGSSSTSAAPGSTAGGSFAFIKFGPA